MFNAIGTVLAWIYDATHSYGMSIVLLTIVVMVVLTPLTLKGTRSMIAMQRLQPEMKKLQTRYKDDRQKLNEEMMAFYKENGINPVSGCLPLVLQLPVFFVLYRVLYGLTNPAPYALDLGRQFARSAKDPTARVSHFGDFHPQHLHTTSNMYINLSDAHVMKSFGLDLGTTVSHIVSTNLLGSWPYLLLLALIAVTAWYQQKQIMGRTPQSSQTPQNQMMMKIMPYILPIYSFILPVGLTLYFLISSVYRIAQQGFITRTMYTDENGNPIIAPAPDPSSDDPPKGFLGQFRAAAAESQSRLGKQGESTKGQGRADLARGAKGSKGASKSTNGRSNGAKAQPNRAQGNKQGAKAAAAAAPEAKRAAPKQITKPPAKVVKPSNVSANGESDLADKSGPVVRPSRSAPVPGPKDKKRRS